MYFLGFEFQKESFGFVLDCHLLVAVFMQPGFVWNLQVALDHGKAAGIVKAHDRIVVCQKVGDSSVVKIIELD